MRYVPCVCNLVRGFYHEWCWYLSNAFFCFYWDDYVGFVFSFVDNGVSHSFVYFKPSLWPWDESSLVMVFDVFGFGLLILSWEFLYLYSSKIWTAIFSVILILFWYTFVLLLPLGYNEKFPEGGLSADISLDIKIPFPAYQLSLSKVTSR